VLPLAALLSLGAASSAVAQNEPVILQAELATTLGSEFSIGVDGATTYIAISPTVGGFNPGSANRVASFNVTFPGPATYELYARLRVGAATFNDDSMYYGNGLGAKNPASDADWILANGLAAPVGFTLPTDTVTGGGTAQSQVWKWVKLSAFDGGEAPVAGFPVAAGSLTQTFQIAGREDGLFIDKLAFGRQGVFFTVSDLDNGLPGTEVPPPPPFVPPGPPIATGKPKFLGGVSSPSQNLNFSAYFNQVTPENGGKWGSVEGTRNVMNWNDLDTAYNRAQTDGIPFRLHTLIWGAQQPGWIESLPPAEQLAEIHEWFRMLSERYENIDFIDVVNEPLHDPPRGAGNGNYIEALGGNGATGWDWILEAFRMARSYFPNAKLGLNEFSVTNTPNDMRRYIEIVKLLQAENLIDTVGVQGHAFSTRGSMATHTQMLDLLATTGLPIYVTELDIDGPTDAIQLADYQRIFPTFWEHPAVRGITLWGYRPGHWRTAQGAYIVLDNGHERPAMVWLQEYVRNTVLKPWITGNPESQTVSVGGTATFTCAGAGSEPLSYQWRRQGVAVTGNATATTPTLVVNNATTAKAGAYDCVVSNSAGSAVSVPAELVVQPLAATVTLSNLAQAFTGTARTVGVATSPTRLAVRVTYNGRTTKPVAVGTYAVVATITNPDYTGSATGTMTITPAP
jgi:endo-1,4-beta-xylanase